MIYMLKMTMIKAIRLQQGLSPQVVAKITGLSLYTIYKVETGKVKPRALTLAALSDAYGMNLFERDDLFDIQEFVLVPKNRLAKKG